jgi:hypothetical protein
MGFLARTIARVPTTGYQWYVVLLEDDWDDELREELRRNFATLARRAGPEALVVRGLDPRDFSRSIYQAYQLEGPTRLPAILVSDLSPAEAEANPDRRAKAVTVVFPLGGRGSRLKGIPELLEKVVQALHDEQAVEAIRRLDSRTIKERWKWLKYVELKPNFAGMGINLNAIWED